MEKLKDFRDGYAIVLYKNYNRYLRNTIVERIIADRDEARYNAESLSRCDGINYSVYDCKHQELIY